MYRKLIVIIIAMSICSSVHASSTNWVWNIGGPPFRAQFGTHPTASDNTDSQDVRITDQQPWYTATYHQQGIDGWTGDAGYYSTDMRAPIPLVVGESKTWMFYLWGDPSLRPEQTFLELGWGYYQPAPAFNIMEYRLTYVQAPEGITGGSVPVGTSILLNQYQQGKWTFPIFRTDNGLEGYKFEFTATVIPEPGSLLALGGGLAALGLPVLRRRKR